jgi:hypothetical protein
MAQKGRSWKMDRSVAHKSNGTTRSNATSSETGKASAPHPQAVLAPHHVTGPRLDRHVRADASRPTMPSAGPYSREPRNASDWFCCQRPDDEGSAECTS